MAKNNMHMNVEIEIPKQTWVKLQKPCRLQRARRPKWIQYTPTTHHPPPTTPSTF